MNKSLDQAVRQRTVSVFILFVIFVLALGGRLFWIQVVKSGEYESRARSQRIRELQVEPARGIIMDRNGNRLAVSTSRSTVVGLPGEVKNPEQTAHLLADILDMEYSTVYGRLTRQADAVYVKRKISEEKKEKIEREEIAGITFTEESERFYPQEELASHLLGFSGIDGQGLEGLELAMDSYLKGSPGLISAEVDGAGRFIPGNVERYIEPEDGYNLHLTVDELIQYIAERELERGLAGHDSSGGSVIIMDPRDGSIRAMANKPDFNPNNFSDYSSSIWRNRAVSDSFEPGSIFKIFVLAAALEEGVVAPGDLFFCPGKMEVSVETINCWQEEGHGWQTLHEVVHNSCNTGFVQIAMRLGSERLHDYLRAFNFGQKTNIQLPGEADGLMYDKKDIGPVELATMSFGHGISVTPIQLITAVSAAINGGHLIRPNLVERVEAGKGEKSEQDIIHSEASQLKQVISEETAELTKAMLQGAVEEGTGREARIEGYNIGGKTGTARHYHREAYDTSFVGVFPMEEPQLVILVVLYGVTGENIYGSQTAAPIFNNISRELIRHLDLEPGEKIYREQDLSGLPAKNPSDVRGQNLYTAESVLRDENFNVNIIGNGNRVKLQVPEPGTALDQNSTILLFTEEEWEERKNHFVLTPDLRDYNIEEARTAAARIGLKISAAGSGKIIGQDPRPGIRVPPGTSIDVKGAH